MRIRVRYFASLREITGKSEETITMPAETDIADARLLLLTQYPALQAILERSVSALNRAYMPAETLLHDGDELAFIPPTGGGSQPAPLIQLTAQPLDRDALIESVTHPGAGGIVVFEGVVRNHARGKQVHYLEYEFYEEMAYEQIHIIATEASRRWNIARIAIAHRSGRLEIGEASVIIVVACPHRAEAFDACRYIIDTLKTTVPIWKKEVAVDGEEWVEG